jgi:hypothetical protein
MQIDLMEAARKAKQDSINGLIEMDSSVTEQEEQKQILIDSLPTKQPIKDNKRTSDTSNAALLDDKKKQFKADKKV